MGVLSAFTFRSYNEGVLREIQNEKRNEVIHIMKKIITFALAALLALSLAACGSEPKTDDTAKTDGQTQTLLTGTISTDGSTSMEKVIGALSESYMAANGGVTVNYNPTGSGSGITAVQEGTCDIGLSSRALKDEEKSAGLKETVLAYDGIAIIVHPDNPVSDLSIDQIAKLYTGEITNWKDVGGKDAEVVPSGADLHRRCHHRREPEPRRHRLRVSGIHQGHREGSERGRRDPQRDHRQGRQLQGAASLRAGDGGGQGSLLRGTVLL